MSLLVRPSFQWLQKLNDIRLRYSFYGNATKLRKYLPYYRPFLAGGDQVVG